MKRYYTLMLVAIALLTTSCEDFLTKVNPDKIESEYYFTNEKSLEIYTNGLIVEYATPIKGFIDGDKYADTHNWDGVHQYYTDNYTPQDASNWSKDNWSNLRSINYFLTNMRKAVAEPEVLDHYEGVGRFFRAMFYINKVKLFGDVPWYDHMVDAESQADLYKKRDSREEVCRHILEDLNYACDHCSDDPKYMVRASFIHKYVALAIKARFCLFEGTYRKYHPLNPNTGEPWANDESETYLRECIDACLKIMNSKVYSLVDEPANRKTQYRDMFINEDACGVYTNEFIWARDYDTKLNVNNKDYSINDYMINAQHANYSFNRRWVNTYMCLDGTPFTGKSGYESMELKDECKDRDYRLAQTIRTPGFTRAGGTVHYAPDVVYAKTGYQPCKWLTDEIKDEIASATASDVPLIRYAEVLLSYAEAKAELGELDSNEWDKSVKLVRERAGVKSIYPKTADQYMVDYFGGSVTDARILEVRRERGVEFPMENLRQDDIMRWAQGSLLVMQRTGIWIPAIETELDLDGDGTKETFVSKKVKEKPGFKVLFIGDAEGHKLSGNTKGNILPSTANYGSYSWRDYKYLHPIPKSALDVNPDLGQNPGW